jgi:aspartyl-tRNA(Asn)/glutamyl-tRNA(Gln) amidotransferase subunit B
MHVDPRTIQHLNFKGVDLALRTALALGSNIQSRSTFDRKHYFYSDLPAGYQITQHYGESGLPSQHLIKSEPWYISTNCEGWFSSTIQRRYHRSDKTNTTGTGKASPKTLVSITTHSNFEQDTAKSTFDSHSSLSYIDLNRAGTGLMEIVSEPDMRLVFLSIF